MDCDRAQYLITLELTPDPDISAQDREELNSHLEVCPECVRDYAEGYWIFSLIKEYGTISDDTRRLLESQGIPVRPPKRHMTVEDGWEDHKRRIPELTQLEKQQKRRKRFYRIGRAAALVALIVLAFTISWKLLASSHSSTTEVKSALHRLDFFNSPKVSFYIVI